MPESIHPSVVQAVEAVRAQCPCAAFLTLGQTVLWDEPVKAAFCRALEAVAPDAQMMAGVHDTDYFAKLPHGALAASDDPFVLLPHNDGTTRGLWSAAGEISSLFGSETVPGRAALNEVVSFDRAARAAEFAGGGLDALLEAETAAPGWRAIVHTQPHPLIAADVQLHEIAPTLMAQIDWAFAESLSIVADGAAHEAAAATAAKLRAWVEEYLEFNDGGTLSDLYRALIPRLWNLVRGGGSCNLLHSASTELFRFNRETCKLPRFRFVDLFLNPTTRETARRCYNDAVRGGGMYALDAFGEGALPFDIVVRGRGRGTLRIHDGSVYIETEEPQTLCGGCDPDSVESLAALLESQFGPEVVLIGKAVSLISMLAAEFVFVFHEKASSYTERTQSMNSALREAGIALPLLPMLRLKLDTWSALGAVETELKLPSHLARAWSKPQVSAAEFAASWRDVCAAQEAKLQQLQAMHGPRELLAYLGTVEIDRTPHWTEKLTQYEAARDVVKASRERADALTSEANALRESAREATHKAGELERAKGEDWRANVLPLQRRISDICEAAAQRLASTVKLSKEERIARAAQEQDEADALNLLRADLNVATAAHTRFDAEIDTLLSRARRLRAEARQNIDARLALERGADSRLARTTLQQIEAEAELEKLRHARDAYLTSSGLRYTALRPTAWWFPFLSPDGAWFHRLVHTMEARVEEL